MIESPSNKEEIRNLEAGFMLLSMYKEYYEMKQEILRVRKLIDSSSYFLLQDFSGNYDEVKASMSELVAKLLEEGYGNPLLLDKKARGDSREEIKDKMTKIREKTMEIEEKLREELEFSLEVLSSIIGSYPTNGRGIELSFLAERLKELIIGLEFRPPIYIGLFIGLIINYMPRVEDGTHNIIMKLDNLKATLLGITRGFGDEISFKLSDAEKERIQSLLKEIDYIKLYVNRYSQLLPGAKRLIEEIEAEIFPLRERKA